MTHQETSGVDDHTTESGSTSSKKKRRGWVWIGVAVAGSVSVLLLIVAGRWEAVDDPSSSFGFPSAARGWLLLLVSLVTAIATVSLAWFARRVPEGVTGLMKRLDDSEQARLESEEARRQVEGHRDTLLTRLTRPYLHGIAISQAQGQTGQNAELRIGEPLGGFAPSLEVTLPLGQLPQTIQITKEKCRELLTEIQRTERVDEAGTAVIRYANVMLVVPVNRPSDNESVPVLVLFPQPDAIGPQVAFGPLTSWQEFREAVQQVANHRLPSRGESLESRTHRSS